MIPPNYISEIVAEVKNLRRNCVTTPETDASYKKIVGMLEHLKGA